jgi:TRAP-type C4-dicarboxylate transport system substrate-binding protein
MAMRTSKPVYERIANVRSGSPERHTFAEVVFGLSRRRTAAMLTTYPHFAFMDFEKVIKTLETL